MPNPAVEQAAAALYDPALPYHNFGHALAVAEEGRRLVERCRVAGVELDVEVVHYACLLHDAGYREDHTALGFESKEAYSAHLARDVLGRCAVDAGTIAGVEAAILSTHCDARCTTPEARAVRAADLAGLGADYAQFRGDALRLRREHEMITGERPSWESWRDDACSRILRFLQEPLGLTPADRAAGGETQLVLRARANVRRLLSESAPGD